MDYQEETVVAELANAAGGQQRAAILNRHARELRDIDAKRGLEYAQRAFALAQAEKDARGMAESLLNASYCEGWLGYFGSALTHGLEAQGLFQGLADAAGLANVLCALARVHLNLGNFPEAAEAAHRAQQMAHDQADPLLEAEAFNIEGITYKRAESFPKALQAYDQSLALYQTYGSKNDEGRLLNNMALVYSAMGQFNEALALVQRGLKLREEPVLRRREGYTQHTLGHIYKDQGSLAEALDHFQQALEIGNELENRYLQLDCLHQMGKIYMPQQPELALAFQQKALQIAEETQSKRNIFRCHEALANIYEARHELGEALSHYKQFYQVKEIVFNEESAGRLVRLELQYKAENDRREAEIYQLRNVELEKEIAERKRLEQELKQLASTDELTGSMNRRQFLETATRELKRACRHKSALSVAVLDIDHFKQINDTYGHAAGDRVLQSLAQVCRSSIREIDLFARFGGDEFVMLMPETSPAMAIKVVERVRLAVAGTTMVVGECTVEITLSAGITSLGKDETNLDILLGRADQGLYQAKIDGRNRVAVKPAAAPPGQGS